MNTELISPYQSQTLAAVEIFKLVSFRVLKAPGGGSSNIFGHYQEQEDANTQRQRQLDNEKVEQSLSQVS